MSRTSTLAALLGLAAAASACAPVGEPLSAANNPSLYSVHQPVVQRTDFVLDLNSAGGGLAQAERDRLNAWLTSIDAGYGDRLYVDEPRGYGDPAARAAVAEVADLYGLVVEDGAPVLNGEIQPGTIRVIASRSTASVPGCPVWSDRGMYDTGNTSSNYGCATNANIAAMVANPDDLVLGQGDSGRGSATTASRAVRTYRERQPSGRGNLPASTTTTGGN